MKNTGCHLHPASSLPQFIQLFDILRKPRLSVREIDPFEISICSQSKTTWKTISDQLFLIKRSTQRPRKMKYEKEENT